MLDDIGAKIYLVKGNDLELKVNAFDFKIHRELVCDLKTIDG